ncbi:MAG TPA: DsbA family protein [Acetobacteraceae bacterium]|nr:DsbA family protein [Acetobacteraceae bacterium]
MSFTLRAALLAGLALGAMPAHAADPAFTPAQRADIISIVRDALKSDPSILRDAVKALQADDDAKEAAATQAALTTHHDQIFANKADAIAGNANGDVTVVEFYDPRCPYCRRMLPGIDTMLQKDKGVRLVFKEIPVLGPASTLEARAIVAAQKQGGYAKMQTALMTNPAQPTTDMISDTAKSIGLNATKLAADMKSDETTKRIGANLDLAHALNITGTPTFIVGEQVIPGMVDVSQLQSAIGDARKHAAN